MTRRCAGSLWVVEWGGTYDYSLAGRLRPASRPDLDGGARLRRTHLETPRSVSRSGGEPGLVEFGDIGGIAPTELMAELAVRPGAFDGGLPSGRVPGVRAGANDVVSDGAGGALCGFGGGDGV